MYVKFNELIINVKVVALLMHSADNRFYDFRHDAQACNSVRCLCLHCFMTTFIASLVPSLLILFVWQRQFFL